MGYEHSITIPAHNPIKIGTLNKILTDVAAYLKIKKETLFESLWPKVIQESPIGAIELTVIKMPTNFHEI
jgi:hypothetical protein